MKIQKTMVASPFSRMALTLALILLAPSQSSTAPPVKSEPPRLLTAYYIWALQDKLSDPATGDALRIVFSQSATLTEMGSMFVALNQRLPRDWSDLFASSGLPISPDRFFNPFIKRAARFLSGSQETTAEPGDYLLLPPDERGNLQFLVNLPRSLGGAIDSLKYTLASDQQVKSERGENPPQSVTNLPGFRSGFPVSYLTDNPQWVRQLPPDDRQLYAVCTILYKSAQKAHKSQWSFLRSSETLPVPIRNLSDLSKWWPLINLSLLRHPWTGEPLKETPFASRTAGSISFISAPAESGFPSVSVCTGRSGQILNYSLVQAYSRSAGMPDLDPPPGWKPLSSSLPAPDSPAK